MECISAHTKREIFSIKILACEKAPSSQIGDQQTDRQDQGKRNGDLPLKVYFSKSLVKVEIGLAKGKKLYDKRDDIAKKDQKREAEREFKIRNFG